eukprot:gene12880-12979_t
MSFADIIAANLLSPAVLCFVLGGIGVALRSDLRLPEPVFAALSIYLMLSIGLRGGSELSDGHLASILPVVIGALVLSCAIPLWSFVILRRMAGMTVDDAACIAAHYGSVSALTFAAVTTVLDRQGIKFEAYAAALLAIMEVPAIIVAIGIDRVAQGRRGAEAGRTALLEILSSKSVLLLAGGLLIGALVGSAGLVKVKPLFSDLFQGALCLFLLELGRVAASQVAEFRKVGWFLAGFSIVMPMLHAVLGLVVARFTGLSEGGAIILATLAASASYIAAPAAIRVAIPGANAGVALTCSVAITFPFNIIVGIPLYWKHGMQPRHGLGREFGDVLCDAVGESGLLGGEAGGNDADARAHFGADLVDEAGAGGAAAAVFKGGEVGGGDLQAVGEFGLGDAGFGTQRAKSGAEGAGVGGMGMGGGEDEGAQGWEIQPEREFAFDDASGFASAAAGDDFDAADVVGVGGDEEAVQGVVGALGRAAVEVDGADGVEFSGAEFVPGGVVQAAGGGVGVGFVGRQVDRFAALAMTARGAVGLGVLVVAGGLCRGGL